MIFAANFKTNHTRSSTAEYLKALAPTALNLKNKDSIYVFPTATSFGNYSYNGITIGAQNAYPIESGSCTGEIGSEQLDEFDIKTILIGHSERRHVIKESSELIKEKFDFFKSKNYEIFFCIGEPLEVMKQGREAVMEYNLKQLEGIDLEYSKLVMAYEPVWAIGTGVSAKVEDIDNIHGELKKHISSPLLYGGSVKPANAKEILSLDSVDGALIGTASWDVDSFRAIIASI
ncbi:MAG: triose-phosphate isomerase [Campylobacterales bacterium]